MSTQGSAEGPRGGGGGGGEGGYVCIQTGWGIGEWEPNGAWEA